MTWRASWPASVMTSPTSPAGSSPKGDYVMIHGRYTGWGPKPMFAVDIFRIQDGKLAEHWDVLQEEVPAGAAKSGVPCSPEPDRTRRPLITRKGWT